MAFVLILSRSSGSLPSRRHGAAGARARDRHPPRAPPPAAPTAAEPTPAPAPLLRTILARLTTLMTLLSSRIVVVSTSRTLKEQFYATAMLLSFVRYEADIGEEEEADKALWSAAVRAGLDAGVEELQQEVIRLRSE